MSNNNNTETLNKMKDTMKDSLNNLKNNPNTQKILNRIDQDKEKLLYFFKTYPLVILSVIFIVIFVYVYFKFFFNRINRFMNRMSEYKVDLLPFTEIKGVGDRTKNYKLCDFYVASSYKSYLPCTNYYDYASIQSITECIKYGARYIDLDIMCKDFSSCAEPVVCNGDEVGNWQYTNALDLNEVLTAITKTAFSASSVKNPTDPLFINFNFKTWGNKITIDKAAKIIKKSLIHRLLSKKYSFQGRFANTNIALTSIRSFEGKIIIISTGDISDTKMDELTNMHSKVYNFRDLTYSQLKETYDAQENMEFNKKNFTRVIPDFKNRWKDNFNYFTPYYLGCQFICMNYTEPTDFMKSYIKRFSKHSFILKPYKLRYHPVAVKQPLQQTKKVSFAPKKVTTPMYSITY